VRLTALGIFATLSAMSVGCVLPAVYLDLPREGIPHPVLGGKGRQVVVSPSFEDGREIRARCGIRKGGFGSDAADVICRGSPSEWIAGLLADELKATGFEIVKEDAVHRESALHVEGTLRKIFVEPVIGPITASIETDLQVDLTVTSGNGLQAKRSFYTKRRVRTPSMQPSLFQLSLDHATQALTLEMVEAILTLANTYPEVGAVRIEDQFRHDDERAVSLPEEIDLVLMPMRR
jgi:hypothetical protein